MLLMKSEVAIIPVYTHFRGNDVKIYWIFDKNLKEQYAFIVQQQHQQSTSQK